MRATRIARVKEEIHRTASGSLSKLLGSAKLIIRRHDRHPDHSLLYYDNGADDGPNDDYFDPADYHCVNTADDNCLNAARYADIA